MTRRHKIYSGRVRYKRADFGPEIPASTLLPGDIVYRKDTKQTYLILSSVQRYGPETRIITRLEMSTLKIEEEEINSLIATYWDHYRDGEKLA